MANHYKREKGRYRCFRYAIIRRSNEKTPTKTFITDLVLQILSYVAQTERENIKQRQKEGIATAKQRGVRFGRPRKLIPQQFAIVREQYLRQEISSRETVKRLHIAQNTFLRWIQGL